MQYLSELTDYKRALRQKNVALKNEMETSAFNSLLISHGSRVMRARQRFISELEHTAAKCHAQISSGEELSVRYDPQVAIGSESTEAGIVEEAFRIAEELDCP